MARKEGMVTFDVEVEPVALEVNLDLDNDEVCVGGVSPGGTRLLAKVVDDGTGIGRFEVLTIGHPGDTITTNANTAVAANATAVPLPPPPAGTKRMTVQNVGNPGCLVRIREVGGPAGSGIVFPLYMTKEYGGGDGALAGLEADEIAGVNAAVAIQFERF